MARRQQTVFDKIWVHISKFVLPMLTCDCSFHSPDGKRNEQNEPSVIPVFYYFVPRDQGCSAGDQLQRDVQRWLSPPDPSTNHDIVWKAHHNGTAAWFFETDVLREWRTTDSLLWIHGKRMFPQSPQQYMH